MHVRHPGVKLPLTIWCSVNRLPCASRLRGWWQWLVISHRNVVGLWFALRAYLLKDTAAVSSVSTRLQSVCHWISPSKLALMAGSPLKSLVGCQAEAFNLSFASSNCPLGCRFATVTLQKPSLVGALGGFFPLWTTGCCPHLESTTCSGYSQTFLYI